MYILIFNFTRYANPLTDMTLGMHIFSDEEGIFIYF